MHDHSGRRHRLFSQFSSLNPISSIAHPSAKRPIGLSTSLSVNTQRQSSLQRSKILPSPNPTKISQRTSANSAPPTNLSSAGRLSKLSLLSAAQRTFAPMRCTLTFNSGNTRTQLVDSPSLPLASFPAPTSRAATRSSLKKSDAVRTAAVAQAESVPQSFSCNAGQSAK